jgi:hypothetical protein
MLWFGSLSSGPLVVWQTKVHPGVGADIVMESISLKTPVKAAFGKILRPLDSWNPLRPRQESTYVSYDQRFQTEIDRAPES